MDKSNSLDKIALEIKNCRKCKINKQGKPVPGEGNPDADIIFLGEAPGKKEADSGRPFIGRSGKFLRQLVRDIGLKEKDVFITSPVKYLPKKGTPTLSDIKHGKKHLEKQIDIIDPKIIVLLGNTAVKSMLEEKVQVLKDHGKIIKNKGMLFFITLHPAAVIRFPKYKPIINSDFKKIRSLI